MQNPDDIRDDSCDGCALATTRRAFLRDGAMAVAAALATLGLAGRANALVVRVGTALAATGSTASYAIPEADGVTIDRDRQIILVRYEGAIYAFALSCPHQNTALKWREEDGRFQCPKHKSKYRPDGTFISGRATRAMDRHALHRDGSAVVVDLDTVYRQDHDAAAWAAALIRV